MSMALRNLLRPTPQTQNFACWLFTSLVESGGAALQGSGRHLSFSTARCVPQQVRALQLGNADVGWKFGFTIGLNSGRLGSRVPGNLLVHSRGLKFNPLEEAKAAAKSVKSKAWNAIPKLPSLPPLPPKIQQIAANARISGSLHKALSLQLEAFWQNYSTVLMGCAGALGVYVLWSLTGSLWSASMRMYVAVTLLLGSYMFVKHRYAIDPEAVYRLGMVRLNTHAGILEVMGAPLAGSDMRAYVLTGGGVRLAGARLKHRSRRVHMVFPLKGSERRGLVFLEAKKRKGKYILKVLGLDVPSHGEQEERLYAIGDSSVYSRGGVLASLRDPIFKAHVLKEVHEREDIEDDLKDDKSRNEKNIDEDSEENNPQRPPKNGGGMYPHEKLYWGARDIGRQVRHRLSSLF